MFRASIKIKNKITTRGDRPLLFRKLKLTKSFRLLDFTKQLRIRVINFLKHFKGISIHYNELLIADVKTCKTSQKYNAVYSLWANIMVKNFPIIVIFNFHFCLTFYGFFMSLTFLICVLLVVSLSLLILDLM